jgi:hypothetical protein
MRDLRKDLEELNAHIVRGEIEEYDAWLEAISRAIEAEDKVATLTEENDLQRQAIQNLSAQVAALRDGLSRISETEACQTELKIKMKQFKMGFAFNREIFEKNNANCKCPKCTADRLLSSPDPGEKYRAMIEVAKELYYMVTNFGNFKNGNSYMGIDEGEVMASKVIAKFEKALSSLEGGIE